MDRTGCLSIVDIGACLRHLLAKKGANNMQRDSIQYLFQWLKGHRRKPLILSGARQVGKSTLVRQFAAHQKLLEPATPPVQVVFELTELKQNRRFYARSYSW